MEIYNELRLRPKKWLVTGVAGFIGSNILEFLLDNNQVVVGLDNFATGFRRNLEEVERTVGEAKWAKFKFIEGDIRVLKDCQVACEGADYVLHQAALGSVPRSINDPIATNQANIDGFLNMLVAAKDAGVKSFTYAASSSTYGDHPALPKIENRIGKPLSPYAVTKFVNELYADVFANVYGFNCVGLRYFNVFGKRQNPEGAYAAVIPKWTSAMLKNLDVIINGDGETSRDFCYVKNVIQANILAATIRNGEAKNQVYNVAAGDRTSLNTLFNIIKDDLRRNGVLYEKLPIYKDFRPGDVRHSQADISKVSYYLGYRCTHNIAQGIGETMPWYIENLLQMQ